MGTVLSSLRLNWEYSPWGITNWFLLRGVAVVLFGMLFVFGGVFGLAALTLLGILIPAAWFVAIALLRRDKTPPDPMPPVVNHRTDRLSIRRLERCDVPAYAASMDDQMLEANGWDETLRRRSIRFASLRSDIGRRYKLVAVDHMTGEQVAFVSLGFDEQSGLWSIGFWVAPEQRGQGFALEALGGSLEVFHQSGLDVVLIGTKSDNAGMNAVIRRSGGVLDSERPHRLPDRTVAQTNWYLHYRA